MHVCLLHVGLQDMVKKPVPFKSPSAMLQEHLNPEHAAHFAAIDKDVGMSAGSDSLPSATKGTKGIDKQPT